MTRIALSTTGQVAVPYDLVIYAASAIGEGKTTEAAKNACRGGAERLMSALRELKKDGVAFGGIRTSLSVRRNDYPQRSSDQCYRATYQAVFDSLDLTRIDQVTDKLTSLDCLSVDAPEYRVRDMKDARNIAFMKAFEESRRLLEAQCATMSLNPKDFDVVDCRSDYGDRTYRGKGKGSFDEETDDQPAPASAEDKVELKIVPGQAIVTVELTVTWQDLRN